MGRIAVLDSYQFYNVLMAVTLIFRKIAVAIAADPLFEGVVSVIDAPFVQMVTATFPSNDQAVSLTDTSRS